MNDAVKPLPAAPKPATAAQKPAGAATSSAAPRPASAAAAPHAASAPLGDDPLAECLAFLTRFHGRAYTATQLRAGLPLQAGQLAPSALEAAAQRIGMEAAEDDCELKDIPRLALPAILMLKDGRWAVLVSLSEKGRAQVFEPRAGDATRLIAVDELSRHYAGRAVYVRPRFQFDARAHDYDMPVTGSWFWTGIRRNFWIYSHAVIATVVVNILALIAPVFTLAVYDRVVPNSALETLWTLAIGVLVVALFDFVLRNLRAYLIDSAGKRLDVELGNRMFEHLLSLKGESRPRSAGSMAVMLKDFDSVRDFLGSATIAVFGDMPFILLFLLALYLIGGPIVALTAAVIVPLVLIVGMLIHWPLKEATRRAMRESTQKNSLLFEVLNGIETVKAVRAEGWAKRHWEHFVALTAASGMRIKLLTALATNFTATCSLLLTLAIIVAGVYQIMAGHMTSGALVAAMMLGSRIMAPLGQMAALLVRYDHMRTAFGALDKMMALPVEQGPDDQPVHVPQIKGGVEFNQVSFRYPGEDVTVLENVSFTVKPGERVAVLGRVGSGKSTILRLIQRLYAPTSGFIRVDDLDLRQIDVNDIRRQVGFVPQDSVLFFGTIRDNLTQGMPHASDEQIMRALELSGLIEAIKAWPRGLGQVVGERGGNLSGGQRQLATLARALIGEPPILLLDEPTSHLDNAVERRFIDAMQTWLKGRTLFLVTHRSALLSLVERVILIDKGKVIADGPRDDVVAMLAGGRVRLAAD